MSYYKSGNNIQRASPIVFNLIIINALVYLAQLFLKQFDVTELGALHYYQSPLFKPVQFVTSMFMHSPSSFGHIIFNMFTLYIFGSMLERFWGSKRFLFFYLICGLGASVAEQFMVPFSAEKFAEAIVSMEGGDTAQLAAMYKEQYSSLGASGAIMGLMAAFAYLFPNTEMMILFVPFPIKAKYIVPIYVLIDLFGGLNRTVGDNVAHFAHLGGALVGFLLVLYWNKTNRNTFY
jgi:membrane associated rhomboid family serine protease